MTCKMTRPNMPGLTVQTDSNPTARGSRAQSPRSIAPSRSSSPVRPTYSPITPVLTSSNLATTGNTPQLLPPVDPEPLRSHQAPQAAQRTYIHHATPTQFIPQPPPEPITLDENPDAIALRSAISILQLQQRRAKEDIRSLQKIKERAVQDPEAFATALKAKQIGSKPDPLFSPAPPEATESDDADMESESESASATPGTSQTLPPFPTPQNVVRCPPVNWAQYGIVGESLDKLHADQQKRPMNGQPAKIGSDGRAVIGEGGRRQDAGVAAPYTPGRDRIEKTATRKGGRR
jgi:hypothetical protein